MSDRTNNFRELTQSVSMGLSTLKSSTPEVMKGFNDLGRAATANGVLDRKTKELIALALSGAARCDPCIGFHMQTLMKLGVTRQETDETLGVRFTLPWLTVPPIGFAELSKLVTKPSAAA